jgi:hypothetical protein
VDEPQGFNSSVSNRENDAMERHRGAGLGVAMMSVNKR